MKLDCWNICYGFLLYCKYVSGLHALIHFTCESEIMFAVISFHDGLIYGLIYELIYELKRIE